MKGLEGRSQQIADRLLKNSRTIAQFFLPRKEVDGRECDKAFAKRNVRQLVQGLEQDNLRA